MVDHSAEWDINTLPHLQKVPFCRMGPPNLQNGSLSVPNLQKRPFCRMGCVAPSCRPSFARRELSEEAARGIDDPEHDEHSAAVCAKTAAKIFQHLLGHQFRECVARARAINAQQAQRAGRPARRARARIARSRRPRRRRRGERRRHSNCFACLLACLLRAIHRTT